MRLSIYLYLHVITIHIQMAISSTSDTCLFYPFSVNAPSKSTHNVG